MKSSPDATNRVMSQIGPIRFVTLPISKKKNLPAHNFFYDCRVFLISKALWKSLASEDSQSQTWGFTSDGSFATDEDDDDEKQDVIVGDGVVDYGDVVDDDDDDGDDDGGGGVGDYSDGGDDDIQPPCLLLLLLLLALFSSFNSFLADPDPDLMIGCHNQNDDDDDDGDDQDNDVHLVDEDAPRSRPRLSCPSFPPPAGSPTF